MTDDKALEHAWRYFALHSAQRMTVFNYFVVFAGVLSTAMAAAIRSPTQFAALGAPLGGLLILLSFVFHKLDQRTSFLVKHAEEAIRQLEPSGAGLLSGESVATAAAVRDNRHWTYGRSFRTIFAIMAAIGAAGAGLSVLEATGVLRLAPEAATPSGEAGCGPLGTKPGAAAR